MNYAIIDIETTGGSADRDKITEIAVFLHDGFKIIDEFTTLINPERFIPYNITLLTGITNEMVEGAPCFYEVARKIVEITENAVFVAHNVAFDYKFIVQEFKNLGYDFKRDTLCTVKLSRKLLPGHRSYSLGKLSADLGIELNNRHRAAGDALATVKLFERLVFQNGGEPINHLERNNITKNINPKFPEKILKDIPEKCGVYYLYNDKKDLIYVGKSRNIKVRILQHLSGSKTKKASVMASEICDISWELTGKELAALLLESEEIKQHKPRYNRAQRRTADVFGLYPQLDDEGYIRLNISKNIRSNPITTFASHESAVSLLFRWIEEFNLCQKLCGLYDTPGSCFYAHINQCKGACTGKEDPVLYNARVEDLIKKNEVTLKSMVLILDGRHQSEKCVIWVENGKYLGYGFFDTSEPITSLSVLKEYVTPRMDNREVQRIISGYMERNKDYKVKYF